MKRINDMVDTNYSTPVCTIIKVEGGVIMAGSPLGWDSNITDPSWNTDGNYGLE